MGVHEMHDEGQLLFNGRHNLDDFSVNKLIIHIKPIVVFLTTKALDFYPKSIKPCISTREFLTILYYKQTHFSLGTLIVGPLDERSSFLKDNDSISQIFGRFNTLDLIVERYWQSSTNLVMSCGVELMRHPLSR